MRLRGGNARLDRFALLACTIAVGDQLLKRWITSPSSGFQLNTPAPVIETGFGST